MPNCSWRDQSHTWIGTTDEGKSKEKNITCYVNDNRDIFISVCCQNNEKGCKGLLGKTDGISIVNMLQDKITIRQLLLEHSSGKISVDYVENTGYAADEEFEDEINYFLSLSCCISYDRECYKCALG
ncbi:MAG: hypothetical protein HFH58_04290 [Lachnospiraceae bacterium]|nr:hypothetical protein [Lachnospiraceae bacterium]MCI9099078.1 hypothetical protein [Lachnospiraceae bacterium]